MVALQEKQFHDNTDTCHLWLPQNNLPYGLQAADRSMFNCYSADGPTFMADTNQQVQYMEGIHRHSTNQTM